MCTFCISHKNIDYHSKLARSYLSNLNLHLVHGIVDVSLSKCHVALFPFFVRRFSNELCARFYKKLQLFLHISFFDFALLYEAIPFYLTNTKDLNNAGIQSLKQQNVTQRYKKFLLSSSSKRMGYNFAQKAAK